MPDVAYKTKGEDWDFKGKHKFRVEQIYISQFGTAISTLFHRYHALFGVNVI